MARLKKFQKLRRSLPIPEVITLGFILYLVVYLKFSKSSLLVLFALGAASVVYLLWWFLDLCFAVPDQIRKLRQFFVEAWTLTRWDFAYRKIRRNWRRSEKQEQRDRQEQKHSVLPFLFLLFGCVGFLSFVPHVSYAFDPSHVTFYTYGSFDIVDNAFRKMSLIFSDSNYKGLFFTIMTMAIFFAGFINYHNAIAQKVHGGLISWALPVLTGFIIYVAFVGPKGQVTIYDSVLNKTDTVGDIPLGITTLAGLSSEVQDGITQIIDTSSVPGVNYRASGGGVGIETVFNIAHNGVESDSVYFDRSMEQYIKDCVLFDLSIGNISWEDFKRGNKSFIDLFSKAVNPSNFTTWYDDAHPAGTTMSCTEAWNNHLYPYMSDNTHFQNALKNVCQSSGLNVSSPTALNNCIIMIEGYLTRLYDGASSITDAYGFIKQAYAANMIDRMVRNANVESVTNYYITTGGASTGITLNSWLPVMRGVLIALGLGLLPFLILFVPTPLGGKILGIIAALFIFIMSWGIADAIMHGAMVDTAVTLFENVRQKHIGYDAFMIMSDPLSKALGMWGYFRTFGLVVAGIAAGGIVKGGAYGIQVLARGVVSPVASKAGGIGAGVANPVERGKIAEELRNSMIAKRVVESVPLLHQVTSGARQKMESISQYGDSAYGNLGDAMKTGAAIGSRRVGDAMSYLDTAGGMQQVKNLAYQMGTKKYGEVKEAIHTYAAMRNLTDQQGAKELGQTIGTVRGAGAAGEKAALGKIGTEGVATTRSGEMINEWSKMYDFYTAARIAGIDPKELGIFKHSHGNLLLDGKTAETFNKLTGHPGKYQKGDMVEWAFNPETGKVSLVEAKRGFLRDEFDISSLRGVTYSHIQNRAPLSGLGSMTGTFIKVGEGANSVWHYRDVRLTPKQATLLGNTWYHSTDPRYRNAGKELMEIGKKGRYAIMDADFNGGNNTLISADIRSGAQAAEYDVGKESIKTSVDHQDEFKTGHVTDPGAEMILITAGRGKVGIEAGEKLDKDISNMSESEQMALLPRAADSFIKTFDLKQDVKLLASTSAKSGLNTSVNAKGGVGIGIGRIGLGAGGSVDRNISASSDKSNIETYSSGMIKKAVLDKAYETWSRDPEHFGTNWARYSQEFANMSPEEQMKDLGFNPDFQQKTMEEKGNTANLAKETVKTGVDDLKGSSKEVKEMVKKVISPDVKENLKQGAENSLISRELDQVTGVFKRRGET